MSNGESLERQLYRMLIDAEGVARGTSSLPFSPSAFRTLREHISTYISNLVIEANRVARRYQADTISSNHVDNASEYLVVQSSRRFYRHLGTLGGVFLGASLSNLVSMTGASQFTTTGVIITVSLGILGSFLIAIQMVKG